MNQDNQQLAQRAKNIRRRIIRLTGTKGMGHTGGSLSMADIMAVLYFHAMNVDPERPDWDARDRFVLSKGHTTPGFYSTLVEKGFFTEDELLEGYDEIDSRFQGHPDMNKTPGVDMSSGSLGQGLSIGLGIALGMERKKLDARAYVLLGDGEMQEGQVWEAIMFAGARCVKRLIAIVDNNRLQLTAPTPTIIDLSPLGKKVEAFGWKSIDCDGHDVVALVDALNRARQISVDGPVMIIADTVKGKGVSFIENRVEWHSKAPNKDEMDRALAELE